MLRLQSGFDDLGVVGDASISTRKGAKMKNIVAWSSQKEATKVWVHDGGEYSHRLITKERHGSSFSFHITTFLPNFETGSRATVCTRSCCSACMGGPRRRSFHQERPICLPREKLCISLSTIVIVTSLAMQVWLWRSPVILRPPGSRI
jgi:hypothetical protein